jgi:hypothetical protein
MTQDTFEPPPIPLCSKALVVTLKRRLHEAVEAGKASDAKIFVDIIERIARMAWLDDLSPQQRLEADNARSAQAIAIADLSLANYLKEQQALNSAKDDHHL